MRIRGRPEGLHYKWNPQEEYPTTIATPDVVVVQAFRPAALGPTKVGRYAVFSHTLIAQPAEQHSHRQSGPKNCIIVAS